MNILNKSENVENKKNLNRGNSFSKSSLKNRIIFRHKNNLSMSSSKCEKSRQIDLSKSSRELIKLNLREKISNYEKNGRIRKIIKNNISDKNNKYLKRITKKFHKKHLIMQKSVKKDLTFSNKK